MESRWLFTLRVNRVPTVLRFSLIPCSEDLRKVHCSPCPPSNYTKDRKTGNVTLLETGRGSGLGGTELRSGQGWKQKHKWEVDEPTQTVTLRFGRLTLDMNA